MHKQEVQFKATENGDEVSAILLKPSMAKALLVFGHGAGAGMEHPFMENVTQGLANYDVASLRYNFPYMEKGKKVPDRPNIATAAVISAIKEASYLCGELPIFAGGKSFGGRMTSLALSLNAEISVKGLIFFGFPLHGMGKSTTDRANHLKEVKRPMLFLQGTRNRLAKLDLIQQVVNSLGSEVKIYLIEDGDHSFKVPKKSGKSPEEVISAICSVSSKWIDVVISSL